MSYLDGTSSKQSRDEYVEFYDIAHRGAVENRINEALGFKRIIEIGSDINASYSPADSIEGSIFIGKGEALRYAAKRQPKAICITDSRIDRSLIATMRDKDIVLCFGFNDLIQSTGLRRQAMLYMSGRLFAHAKRKGINITFASLARQKNMLLSYMQLIELAKLIGASEDHVRESIGKTTPGLIE